MTNFFKSPVPRPVQMNLPMTELKSFNEPAGSFRRKESVVEALKTTLKNCQLSRKEIAEEMTRLVTEDITENHIANWAAESKNGWRMPLEYAAAFYLITGDPGVIRAALAGSGIGVLSDKEFVLFELGKIVADERTRSKKKRQVMEALGL